MKMVNIFHFFIVISWCILNINTESQNSISLYFYSAARNKEQLFQTNNNLVNFNSNYSTKLLIHGYIANRNHRSIEPVKNAYLARGNVNLLIADWEDLALKSYDESRAMVPKVGLRIGELMDDIARQHSIDLNDIHVIGHSLGAHIAGNVGRYFKGNIGRITGLDPAGPLFFKWSTDAIRPSDGQFVDIIHTCANALGEIWTRGQVDFYPNSGLPSQPGCHKEDIKTLFSCSHFRAPKFFAESILVPSAFQSIECSVAEILEDMPFKCAHPEATNDGPAYMGDGVQNNLRGVYYLETNDMAPYGKGFYLDPVMK